MYFSNHFRTLPDGQCADYVISNTRAGAAICINVDRYHGLDGVSVNSGVDEGPVVAVNSGVGDDTVSRVSVSRAGCSLD